MGGGCWIKSMYEMEYGYRIVNFLRIFICKIMATDQWLVCQFRMIGVFWI